MMTIKEYFDHIEKLFGFDTRDEMDCELWEKYNWDEEFDIEAWAAERNVDLEVKWRDTQDTIFTQWCWDHCE